MSSTMSVTEASQVRLSKEHINIASGAGADIPPAALELANKLLQRNHDEHHIFFRDVGGHNHTVHNVLTRIALGASPAEIEKGFNVNLPGQRPVPEVDNQIIRDLYDEKKFYGNIAPMNQKQYTNFLVFFEQQIEQKGWKAVVTEYVFSRSRNADTILGLMYDGAFHSIIHLGLGVEFQLPSIIAEALAQAAVENSSNISQALLASEQEALKSGPAADTSKPLVELIHEARANETIRNAPQWSDTVNKMRDGVLGRAGPEITSLMAQFRVTAETLERRAAEAISCAAYIAGAAQRPGKARKIDFFLMHCVTSTIFVTVFLRQPWIRTEDKVRLVEWKGRIDLAWYPSCGSPVLDTDFISDYKLPSGESDWNALFRAVNAAQDDGHVAKFVRSLKNGEEVSKPFLDGEGAKAFPVQGDMWLKLGWMTYDSTVGQKPEQKWPFFTGFDQAWASVPDTE